MNAVIHASRHEMVGGTLFLAGLDYKTGNCIDSWVCRLCKRAVINAGLTYVYLKLKIGFKKEMVEGWLIEGEFCYDQPGASFDTKEKIWR